MCKQTPPTEATWHLRNQTISIPTQLFHWLGVTKMPLQQNMTNTAWAVKSPRDDSVLVTPFSPYVNIRNVISDSQNSLATDYIDLRSTEVSLGKHEISKRL